MKNHMTVEIENADLARIQDCYWALLGLKEVLIKSNEKEYPALGSLLGVIADKLEPIMDEI